MNLANVTHKTLSQDLQQEVPESYVVVAKHQIAGMGAESIAEVIGVDAADITALESDPLFKTVRQTLGAMASAMHADQPLLLDSIESVALRRLADRLEHERDPEFLLKVAATTNRMQRRSKPVDNVLDPSRAGRAAITLTSRMVQRITQAGHRETLEEKTLSIHDGSMQNVSFDEVNDLLAGGLKPQRTQMLEDNSLMQRLDQQMKDDYG